MVCGPGILALVLSLAPGALGSAHAAVITVEYSGHITSVIDPNNDLDPSIEFDTPFFGSFSFETVGVEDQTPDDPELGTYFYHLPFMVDLHVGNMTFERSPYAMSVHDTGPENQDLIRITAVNFQAENLYVNALRLSFFSKGPGMLLSIDPPVEWDIEDFLVPSVVVTANDSDVAFVGIIDALTVVPEPSSVLLVLGGIIGCCCKTRQWRMARDQRTALLSPGAHEESRPHSMKFA